MIFLLAKMFYRKKTYQKQLLLSVSESKKQNGITKDPYKFFKDQVNFINNNKEDDVKAEIGVKTEDGETTKDLHHKYIGDQYKVICLYFQV